MLASFGSASTFVAVSLGTYNNSFGSYYTTAENVLSSVTAPYAALNTLDFTAIYGGSGVTTGSLAVYKNAANTDTLTLAFVGGPFTVSGFNTTSSISGSWNFVSGTGSYASVASGSGTWSASYNALAGSLAQTTFVGDLNPVPEPASMAILAVGALGMARRRRNRA